jgi:hypothetical protein
MMAITRSIDTTWRPTVHRRAPCTGPSVASRKHRVRRKSLIYFSLLATDALLFGLAAFLTPRLAADTGELGLLRFVVLCLATGSAIATWATAVTIASVHKRTWALFATVAVVVAAGLAFAIACGLRTA